MQNQPTVQSLISRVRMARSNGQPQNKMNIIKLLRHPQITQFIRFGLTGGLASLVNYVLVILLVEFTRIHPLDANIIGFSCGFVVSFVGNRYWTFPGTRRTMSSALPRFFLLAAINFILNQSLFYLLLRFTKLHYTLSLLLVIITLAFFTYFLSKFWVFPKQK
jgi:putative flippase GtrA